MDCHLEHNLAKKRVLPLIDGCIIRPKIWSNKKCKYEIKPTNFNMLYSEVLKLACVTCQLQLFPPDGQLVQQNVQSVHWKPVVRSMKLSVRSWWECSFMRTWPEFSHDTFQTRTINRVIKGDCDNCSSCEVDHLISECRVHFFLWFLTLHLLVVKYVFINNW